MSAPLFLVDALPAGDTCTLAGAEGHHAADVVRLRVGEPVLLGDGRGGVAHGHVTAVARGEVQVAVAARRREPAPDPRLVVVQGLPKGERGELAVQAMTEVGVAEIVPWAARRSVAVWRAERGRRAQARWAATAREAAKQARRAWLPAVAGAAPDPTGPTPEGGAYPTARVAARVAAATGAFLLHEEADAPLSAAALPAAGDILLVVGPEGGVDDAEVAALRAAGAVPVRLGRTVLRTSTAGVAALAVLQARLGYW
ncbi:ribosomal RNA small subunit methyltransferase E [Pilimelia terevasa]|uniref:Ribosomal RNA small subunit methyltransferase E n=1 Tax=Pilimelia terevasa TaxID=53372 RepID=A0A8J3BRQ7_9ACTN|nr:16S rRNA (uracil(1498)-N(3))-methyltransferase [Pilimelia terevasa]GGK41148.1 ribosomal RNA small subunit methyltransferase E [Pilimelia terevasa]